MSKRRFVIAAGAAAMLLVGGLAVTRAQDPVPLSEIQTGPMPVSDPSCTYFGADRERYLGISNAGAQGRLTLTVRNQFPDSFRDATMPSAPGGSRTYTQDHPTNTIDKYIFPALTAANVAPAPATTDWEFVRRIYLDLTGRIPTTAQTTSFVNDTTADKRSKLVDSLVGSPAWVDKWTVWFGDLYQNNSQNSQFRRFIQGVTAFNAYTRAALVANKPYNQIATDLITTQGTNSFVQGEVNYLAGGVVTGGPAQDIYDQQVANTATTFLGLSNLNCLLCHDGRGHLDQVNLWGYYTSRKQAWGMSSFLSRTKSAQTATATANVFTWSLQDTNKTDYALGSTTGNRPPRLGTGTVSPKFILTGAAPNTGENYRVALARMVTSDFQFSRATVNYIWEYFFTVGIVSPSNQFDPYRLDPNNPPSGCPPGAPCTLQPSNPQLLNALAQDFVNSGYDIQALMKEIVNSNTYQLSSRYNGTWDPSTANLFGRKLVRRLWSEEVHDAITTSSGEMPTYQNVSAGVTNWGPVSYAMQLPEPLNTPDGATGAVSTFLNAFLRGNRDDQPRRPDGSISQALGLMNDNFVMSRIQATTNGGLLKTVLAMPAAQDGVVGQGGAIGGMVDTMFMTVLSRHPTDTELSDALANLRTNRTQEAQNLIWTLYNKVDFVFNY